jgi:hypothetical protein
MPYTDTPSLFYDLCTWFNFGCSTVLSWFADMTTKYDDLDRMGVFTAHEPGGTSLQDMIYWQ